MPGRHFASEGYRYGFNGKENDNETVGTGEGTQDYGMRIYNPSLGKFLSVDPLTKDYPWNSPYAFAENRPIQGIDLEGGEFLDKAASYVHFSSAEGGLAFRVVNFTETQKTVWKNIMANPANWNKAPNATVGASTLLAPLTRSTPDKAPNESDANDVETSSTSAQTEVLPQKNVKAASGPGSSNNGTKYRNGNNKAYTNTGPGAAASASKCANVFMAAVGLYQWIDETTNSIAWANVQQTSWQQSKFAQRTVKVFNDAVMSGMIDEKYQSGEGMYNVLNYMLLGDAFGDAKAEEIALKVMKGFGIPIRQKAPANSPPASATTYGTVPSGNSSTGGKPINP